MRFFFDLFKIFTTSLLLIILTSCSNRLPSEINENNAPTEIIKLGDEAYAKGYFERAGDYYVEINKYFPYSIEDETGLSKAVDAYYKARKFEDSRLAATKFLSLYPESKKAQSVLYFRSKSFCDEIDIVERDQAAAKDCITSFSAFKNLYPKSASIKEAEKDITKAREFLVGQQLSIGKYYLKRNNPNAAMRRFKTIKTNTARSKFLPEVSYRLIESLLLLGLGKEAIAERENMIKKFPNSTWTTEAVNLVEKSGFN